MQNMRTLRRGALGLGAAGILGLVIEAIASCGSTTQTPAPSTGAPIHIGIVIALSGDLKGTGAGLQNAALVAEQQLNAYGGILGRKVVFDVKDDQTDSQNIIKGVVNDLLGQHTSAILGPIGSGQVLAVDQLTYAAKTIQITATATSTKLSSDQPSGDRYLFRTVPADDLQAKALALFAYAGPSGSGDAGTGGGTDAGTGDGGVSDGGGGGGGPTSIGACRKMVIVHNNDDYGNPFATSLTTEFGKLGGSVVDDQQVQTVVQPKYDTVITSLQNNAPDCMAMIVYDPAGDEIVHEIRIAQGQGKISNNLLIIGTDGTYTQDFIVNGQANKGSASSPSVVEGVYGTNPDSNPTERTQYGDFAKLYLAQYALDPGATDLPGQAANFYDAAILAALAIQKAGGTDDPVKIRDSLYAVSGGKAASQSSPLVVGPGNIGDALVALNQGKDINYEGASGDVDFDDTGDVVGGYIIWKVVHPDNTVQPSFQTVQKISADTLKPAQ